MRSIQALPLVTLAILSVSLLRENILVVAHPGAVAEGRATCGSEYSTPETAYLIPDIGEAWFIRRVATCEQPSFWNTFEISRSDQQLYIAVISPELDRFEDKLDFNAILYGPQVSTALDGLSAVNESSLPAGIVHATNLGPSGFMQSPEDFSSCAFVDTNPVMRSFSDVIGGRCMEDFSLSSNYKDKLQADTNARSWWLYSFNHRAAAPGTYYLQSWLTDRATGKVAQGKYEITLGPWSWSSYASTATLNEAQEQGTACNCAVNALHYKELYTERLGSIPDSIFPEELPGGSCAASPQPESPCVTQGRVQYLSDDSAVEWSGVYELEAGKTYNWTFRAYYDGKDNGGNAVYGYPDPGMDVFIVSGSTIFFASDTADAALKGNSTRASVPSGATLEIAPAESQVVQFIQFTDPATGVHETTVLLKPAADGSVAVFTQHVPSEFMAQFLIDADTGAYVWPSSPTLYADLSNGGETTPTPETTPEPDSDSAAARAYGRPGPGALGQWFAAALSAWLGLRSPSAP